MTGVLVIGIVFSSILIAIGIIAATIVALARGGRTPLRARSDGKIVDETRMIQELHEGLLEMEKRVESLETILLERERKEKVNGSAQ